MGIDVAVRAPASGSPFENLMAGVLLAIGFIVDVDALWTVTGEGDVAQFDIVASAPVGSRLHRLLVECKGGDKWGYGDAFQLLGEIHALGEGQGVLLAAQRRSLEQGSRTAQSIDRLFRDHGLHVVGVPIDDRMRDSPIADVQTVASDLFNRGLVPIPDANLEIDNIEVFTPGIARLRGAMKRVASALGHPMSAPSPPAAALIAVVRDWTTISSEGVERLNALRSVLVPSVGSQSGWYDEAKAAHPHFGRDVAIVEAYAGAQEIAALADAIRNGWTLPSTANVSHEFRSSLPALDLHNVARAAYILALSPPSSSPAAAARMAHGQSVAVLTSSPRLRKRCREPRKRTRIGRRRRRRQ